MRSLRPINAAWRFRRSRTVGDLDEHRDHRVADVEGQTVGRSEERHVLVVERVHERAAADGRASRMPLATVVALERHMLPDADLMTDLVTHDRPELVAVEGRAVHEAAGVEHHLAAL